MFENWKKNYCWFLSKFCPFLSTQLKFLSTHGFAYTAHITIPVQMRFRQLVMQIPRFCYEFSKFLLWNTACRKIKKSQPLNFVQVLSILLHPIKIVAHSRLWLGRTCHNFSANAFPTFRHEISEIWAWIFQIFATGILFVTKSKIVIAFPRFCYGFSEILLRNFWGFGMEFPRFCYGFSAV